MSVDSVQNLQALYLSQQHLQNGIRKPNHALFSGGGFRKPLTVSRSRALVLKPNERLRQITSGGGSVESISPLHSDTMRGARGSFMGESGGAYVASLFFRLAAVKRSPWKASPNLPVGLMEPKLA